LASASSILVLASLAMGCSAEVGQPASVGGTGQEAVGKTEEAFSGNWNYSWGVTNYSVIDIGTAVNRSCFLSGVSGALAYNSPQPGDTTQLGTGVYIDANNEYHLYVQAAGAPLQGFARCVNTSAGLTTEQTWRTGQSSVYLAPHSANRRCFLTNVVTSVAYPTEGGFGFKQTSDYARVWDDGFNWYVGGVQSGVAWASARCIDVNGDDGGWLWQAGDPGTRKDNLAYNPGGVTCLLTGLGGHFTTSDWSDGAFITYDSGVNQFYMNTKNGKRGWADCVN
jgi:hypothetical protein